MKKTDEEVPYFEDEDSKLHPGLHVVERPTINVILWNPRTNEFVCLDWQKFGWKTFIIGGIEEGESAETAASREIEEETRYTDVEFVAELGKLRSGYFAAHKNENRIANTTGFLFKLTSDGQKVNEDAAALPHVFVWIPRERVADYLTPSSQKYLWEKAQPFLS
ncbi:MAG: NUDIX domain-containing protein [Candidatus Paceibacterota bacterium]